MRKPPLDAQTPRLLAGRYQLFEQLAAGTMASVWRGHDQVLGRDVAVKLLHAELAADADFAGGFRAEAVNAAKLNHPNIVGVFDIGEHEGVPYLVMELVEGASLKEALSDTGPLTPDRAIQIGANVATALAYAHRSGVLHRNVKPANILLTTGGGVKVSDFALARAAGEDDATRTAELLGVGYLAPEQSSMDSGDGAVDARTDVYALGACMYEMLIGKTPWQAVTPGDGARPDAGVTVPGPRALRTEVPGDLDELVLTALASEPDERFQSAEAMAHALVALVAADDEAAEAAEVAAPGTLDAATGRFGEPVGGDDTVTRPDVEWPPPELRPRPPRHPLRLVGTGLGLLTLVALVALVANYAFGPSEPGQDGGRTTVTAEGPAGDPAVEVVASGVVDPGDGVEKDELLLLATDGDPDTAWNSETYSTQDFGQLKDGVGLIVQVFGNPEASTLTVHLELAGGSAEIYGASQPSTDLADWNVRAGEQPLEQDTEFELVGGASDAYYLIWFTSLPVGDNGGFRALVSEIELAT
jgi:hypothetical protein